MSEELLLQADALDAQAITLRATAARLRALARETDAQRKADAVREAKVTKLSAQAADASAPRFLDEAAVVSRTGLSARTILRLRRAKKFPDPRQLSPGRVGWSLVEDIVPWEAAQQPSL